MKHLLLFACIALMTAACSDNGSSDDSQNNSSSTLPMPDSATKAHDSTNPTLEGNQNSPSGAGQAGSNGSAKDSSSKGNTK